MTQPGGDVASTTARAEPLLLGNVVSGKYKVLSLIATGGMGRIYKAEQIPLGRIVALKTLISAAIRKQQGDPSTPSGAQFKQRFFREASVLSKLQHPNIVTVFDYGRIEGVPGSDDEYYMAMEYLAGKTLLDGLSARIRFPATEVIWYLRQVAQGLRAAHGMGVVHRDLKPSNLMIVKGPDDEEILKILDFGIIKLLNDNTQDLTQEGVFVGSPRYMAPEQIVASTVDVRADIYSLGVIAYQLLTGQVPFNGETAVQTMMAHVNLPLPPMRSVYKDLDVPEWLEQLVERCLEKDPAARPNGVDEIIETIRSETSAGPSSLALRVDSASAVKRNSRDVVPTESVSNSPSAPIVSEARAEAGRPLSPRSGIRGRIWFVLALCALATGSVVVLRARKSASSTGTSAPTASVSPSPASSFDLLVDSVPSGAMVRESGRPIGTTPLHIQVDNSAVRDKPRSFELALDGYQSYSVTQGPSDSSATIRAMLEQLPVPTAPASAAPSSPSAGSHPTKPQRPSAVAASIAPPPPPRPLDIETTR